MKALKDFEIKTKLHTVSYWKNAEDQLQNVKGNFLYSFEMEVGSPEILKCTQQWLTAWVSRMLTFESWKETKESKLSWKNPKSISKHKKNFPFCLFSNPCKDWLFVFFQNTTLLSIRPLLPFYLFLRFVVGYGYFSPLHNVIYS